MRDMVNAVLPWRFGVLMIEKTIYLFEKDAQTPVGVLCAFFVRIDRREQDSDGSHSFIRRGSVAGVAFADEGVVRVTFADGTAADVAVAFAAAPVFEGSVSIYDL